MTDTTDIAALREACEILNDHGYLTKSGKIRSSNLAEAVRMIIEQSVGYAEQLEAERQLSDALQAERDEFRRRLKLERSILEDADKELAALKSDQVPVGKFVFEPSGERWHHIKHGEHQHSEPKLKLVKLFTAHQKPVISKEKLCDWLEDEFDIDDSQREALAADFAHCCDCIVKDGE